ncbi:MAG: hypothetical protein ACRDST_16205, partial [Pseudonocardiaceae bacterium]
AKVDEVTVGLIGKPGEEPEIPLTDLEGIFVTFRGDTSRANEILAWAKEHQPAATAPTKAGWPRPSARTRRSRTPNARYVR